MIFFWCDSNIKENMEYGSADFGLMWNVLNLFVRSSHSLVNPWCQQMELDHPMPLFWHERKLDNRILTIEALDSKDVFRSVTILQRLSDLNQPIWSSMKTQIVEDFWNDDGWLEVVIDWNSKKMSLCYELLKNLYIIIYIKEI